MSFWRHLNNRREKLIHIDVHYYQIIDTSIDNIRAWCSSSYGSWINNYLCNQCISPLMLWVLIPLMRGVLDTTLCDKVCQWLAASRFSPIIPVSSTNKSRLPRYKWNIVESIVKHHNPYPNVHCWMFYW